VVRGDVLLLAEGDRIAADGTVLLQAHELATDESMLTGESEAVPKQASGEPGVCRHAGGVSGQGMVRVDATGARTELGRIGNSLQAITCRRRRCATKWRG
jgi:Ca2+-transporting ATPase